VYNEAGDKVESGLMIMRFISGFEPRRFDSTGTQVDNDIGWGSKCRISFILKEYNQDGNKGLAKYIRGIQIIELKAGGATAESCGFDKVEGGFEAEKPAEEEVIDFNT
jgi:hypothetical protein